jgi:hypothetical protein
LLSEHQCRTAQFCGWGGKKNGELLGLAETQFDLFLTADQELAQQQRVTGRRIAILVLSTNDVDRVIHALPEIRSAIDAIQPGQYRELSIP